MCSVGAVQSWMGGISAFNQLKQRSCKRDSCLTGEDDDNNQVSDERIQKSSLDRAQSALDKAAAYRKKTSSGKENSAEAQSNSRLKLAMDKAAAYRKNTENSSRVVKGENPEENASKAPETNGQEANASKASDDDEENARALELEEGFGSIDSLLDEKKPTAVQNPSSVQQEEVKFTEEQKKGDCEVEIITRDGVIKRKVLKPEDSFTVEIKKKGMEFVGLDFNEKKKSGRPAGLTAEFEAPRKLPKVEIITRDAAGTEQAARPSENLYKPKVSTWGVFPRPSNISKTYGGGRTIKPGEELETEDEKQASEARTRKLIAEYRKKMGLDIDPLVVIECQKMMEEADGLVKCGRLREAVVIFETILQKMVFQSEVHGQAALAKGLCLESQSRTREARPIYEKLRSHPNQRIKKKAKELLFSFEAAEKLKFSGSSEWDSSAYQQYFELIPRKFRTYNTSYKASEDEEPNGASYAEVWPYILLAVAPIVLVFVFAALKRKMT